MALPHSPVNGLGMNDAWTPRRIAVCLMTWRYVMMLSAIVRASAYRRSISCCDGATSWWEYSTEIPIFSSMVMACRRKSDWISLGVRSK